MEEFKGTKGKWIVLDLDDIFIKSENGQQVLRIESNGFNPNAQANAQLIASAPELLEALQMFVDVINRSETAILHYGKAINLAEKAIFKALGND